MSSSSQHGHHIFFRRWNSEVKTQNSLIESIEVLSSQQERPSPDTMNRNLALILIITIVQNQLSVSFEVKKRQLLQRHAIQCSLSPKNENVINTSTRRKIFRDFFSAVSIGAISLILTEQPASATYSAYARREEDWQGRVKDGKVEYSTASSLRSQLREIAPMNTENSKIFCPNGPTSNVSPLMENKCGDKMATPSVFGRTSDVVGNSIPGVSPELRESKSSASSNSMSSLSSEVGGFPSYLK